MSDVWRYFWPISGVVSAGDSDDYHILAASECRDSWDNVSSPKSQQCFLTRECNTQPRSQIWVAMHKEPPAKSLKVLFTPSQELCLQVAARIISWLPVSAEIPETKAKASFTVVLQCFITRECNTQPRSQFWVAMHKEPLANLHITNFLSWRVSSNKTRSYRQDVEVQLWLVGDTAFPSSGFLAGPHPDNLPGSHFWIWLIMSMSYGQYIHSSDLCSIWTQTVRWRSN